MGNIKVVLEGHKSNGGYLTIMRPNMSYDDLRRAERKLYNGTVLYLPDGPQTLRLDPVGIEKRYKVQYNYHQKRDRYRYNTNDLTSSYKLDDLYAAAREVDNLVKPWETTIDVTYDTLVTITVNSDYNGKILGVPRFDVSVLSSEELRKLAADGKAAEEAQAKKREEDRQKREEAEKERKEKARKKTLLIWGSLSLVCLFGLASKIAILFGIGLCVCAWKLITGLINP